MKKKYIFFPLIALFVFLTETNLSAQSCTDNRYQSHYFSSNTFYPDIVYSRNIEDYVLDLNLIQDLNILPVTSGGFEDPISLSDIDLTMDIRLPPTSDTLSKRPVFIWAFPGGFISGSKEAEDMQALIDTFALRGYVTASIHYRIGADVTTQSSVERAVYRGSQDASAAIRFFKENANILNIDTNFIFFGGSSAGALAGLHVSFLDEDERAADLPSTYDIPNPLLLPPLLASDLGLLHSHQVTQITGITSSAINVSTGMVPANHLGKPKGLVSCWGAIGDLDWLDNRPDVPDVLIFHGTGDAIVYHDCQPPFSNLVGGIGGLIVDAPVTCGGDEMDDVLIANGIPTESYIEVGAPHEFWGALNGDFDNDFLVGGFGALGYDTFHWPDMIQKIGNFAYNCMKPALPVVTGNSSVCANDVHTYSVPATATSIYCWTVTGGTIVSSDLDAATIDIQWGSGGNGIINVREITYNVVESDLATYNVTIVPVNVPTGVTTSNLTSNSVDLNWATGPAGVSYEIEYRPIGGSWMSITSSINMAILSSLSPCTNYEYRIKTICSATSESAWTTINTFTTPPANAPTGVTASNLTSNSVDLNWASAGPAGVSYEIEYRPIGGSWMSTTSTVNMVILSSLSPCTDYEYRIKTICSATSESAWTTINTFTTPPANPPTGVTTSNLTNNSVDLNWVAGPTGVSYEIEYRPIGGSWMSTTSTVNMVILSSLSPCTDYEYRIKTICSATSESAWTTISTFTTLPLILQLKLVLEGAYNGSNMNNNLSGSIPTMQPYSVAPWSYAGTEMSPSIPSNTVDWIKIELLDGAFNLIDETVALVRTDGVVTDVNGTAGVGFCNATAGNYYLLVRHRNHLDVVSANTVTFPNGSYDFTTSTAQALGQNQLKSVGGIAVLHAGDYNGNGIISVEDYNDFVGQSSSNPTGYTTADGNLDLNMTTADFNAYRPNASIIGMPIVRY